MSCLGNVTSAANPESTVLQMAVQGFGERQSSKLLGARGEFALCCMSNEFLLPGLRLAPVSRFETLAESLAVHRKIRMPSFAAFVKRHQSYLKKEFPIV